MALPIVFEGRTGAQIAGDVNAELGALGAEVDGLRNAPLKNYVPGSLNRWINARANARAGTSSSTVAFAGTSLLMGAYAGGLASANSCRPLGPNVRVASELARLGVPTESRSFMGNGYAIGVTENTLQFFDSRISVSGGWAPNQTIGFTAGGHPVRGSSAGTISFSFSGAADTVVIYEIQTNAFATGTYSVNIDGSTTVSASQTTNLSANSVRKVVLPFTAVGAGAHTLNIVWGSGTPAILGAEVYSSTSATIRCLNVCAGSSAASDWARPQFSGAATFVVPSIIAPALVLFDIGANDWVGGVSLSAFEASINTALAGFLSASDVIAMTPFPTRDVTIPRATQQLYVDALIRACVSFGIPYIDVWNDIGTWESMSLAGKPTLTADSYHYGAGASWEYPDRIVNALMAV